MQRSGTDTRTDVLVIGAGLAGFRAAISAKEKAPYAHVLLATLKPAAHGSSFFNIHNKLGIQVCLNESEKRCFQKEALALAPPGFINEALVRVMADESREAFAWLQRSGAKMQEDSNGEPIRVNGCFSPHQKRAFLIRDVNNLFYALMKKATYSGVTIRTGLEARKLLSSTTDEEPGVSGALFRDLNEKGKKTIKIDSDIIILACGGQTASLKPHISGAGESPRYLHEWCADKKIQYINNDFTQFTWCRAKDFESWNITCLAHPGACYKDTDGKVQPIPDRIRPLFRSRCTHAPVSYGLEDRAIDQLLMKSLDSQNQIPVFHPDTGWIQVTLAAQASNGGIRIDENGFTGLKGLYACGECSGGMHGADRIGGAMVLSCLVFGKRAGAAAAKNIKKQTPRLG